MASSSRQIKQELLEMTVPEIYTTTRRRRRAVKVEPSIKLEAVIKKPKKRSRSSAVDDEIEFLGATAKRRPYQWQGRRVKRVLRPGTTVVFSPGERNQTRALKRTADELFADSDILDQAANLEGEFAYGKRKPPSANPYFILDSHNPTPSLAPITPQVPIAPVGSVKRPAEAVSTIQVLAPKKRKIKDEEVLIDEMIPLQNSAPLPVSENAGPRKFKRALKRFFSDASPLPVDEIKVRDTKPVAPGLAVQTVDVKVPMDTTEIKKEEEDEKPIQTMEISYSEPPSEPTMATPGVIYPQYRLHPSMIGHPPVVRTRTRRVKSTPRATNTIFPEYRLHPSMIGHPPVVRTRRRRRRATTSRRQRAVARTTAARNGILLPSVRYHPSITVPNRREVLIVGR